MILLTLLSFHRPNRYILQTRKKGAGAAYPRDSKISFESSLSTCISAVPE
jgi:hypothetical protein